MITEITMDYKEYRKNIGSGKNSSIAKSWFASVRCPNPQCGAVGQFCHHGYYDRYILFFEQSYWKYDKVQIIRGRCRSCDTTHAFLPADIIPYRSILIPYFLAMLLSIFFVDEDRTEPDELPEKESLSCYDESIRAISIRGYYKLLSLFRAHLKYIEGIMREIELWTWSQRLPEASAARLLFRADLQTVQEKMLSIHRIPLFFQRKRTAAGFPLTGSQKGC